MEAYGTAPDAPALLAAMRCLLLSGIATNQEVVVAVVAKTLPRCKPWQNSKSQPTLLLPSASPGLYATSPLHLAFLCGDAEAAELLMSAKADVPAEWRRIGTLEQAEDSSDSEADREDSSGTLCDGSGRFNPLHWHWTEGTQLDVRLGDVEESLRVSLSKERGDAVRSVLAMMG
eukprot:gnl/TRDRNA2_/TRDRNA2_33535_c0_seq1.p1 gnl/TRDRNA2_/TRDRNA2_33535_c0~~gnl/TRDRNA2_/TRDRNA2_33535_c0_seq1.p1  ORF type:complete len:196 (-),score=24.41 gnl/TRDRNA2_/TRDRNA2_33535_c0_seq1:383-904(-)